MCGTIPIYLGAPDITNVVPMSCFIDMRGLMSNEQLDALLRHMTEEDYREYRKSMKEFLEKERNGVFNKKKFSEQILKEIQDKP